MFICYHCQIVSIHNLSHYPRRSTRFVLCFVFLSYETDVLFFLLMEVHLVLHDVENDSKFKPFFQFSSILISQINNLLLEYTQQYTSILSVQMYVSYKKQGHAQIYTSFSSQSRKLSIFIWRIVSNRRSFF